MAKKAEILFHEMPDYLVERLYLRKHVPVLTLEQAKLSDDAAEMFSASEIVDFVTAAFCTERYGDVRDAIVDRLEQIVEDEARELGFGKAWEDDNFTHEEAALVRVAAHNELREELGYTDIVGEYKPKELKDAGIKPGWFSSEELAKAAKENSESEGLDPSGDLD